MSQRILLLSHHRTFKTRVPWRVGGIARTLAARGDDVTVVCTADRGRRSVRDFAEDGVRYVEIPDLLSGRLRSGWDPWSAWHRLRWLRQREFDLVHAFETRPAIIHPLLAALRRRPAPLVLDWCDWYGRGGLIVENRPGWYRALFGGVETYYEEHFRARADATTLIARGLTDRATALGVPAESIFWVPNGCSPGPAVATDSGQHRARFGLPARAFLVGYSALDVNIGLDFMLAGFARAAAQRPDLALLVTGSGSARATARARQLGLAERVHALGSVPRADYLPAIACADAFLLPFVDCVANLGRWPGRINDYLSLGRPVVVQPVGEMRRLLTEHQVGLLADETPEAVAQALCRLHDDPALARTLGRNAQELAAGALSWNAVRTTLDEAYACARARFARRRGA